MRNCLRKRREMEQMRRRKREITKGRIKRTEIMVRIAGRIG